MTAKNFTVAVVGGGIGGLAFSIGLLKQGVEFHIYEAASKFSEIGAGISFGPNALKAMSLINPLVREAYERRATENQSEDKKDGWFDFRWGMDHNSHKSGEMIYGVIAGDKGHSTVHRAHFLDEMVKLIPEGSASFGKRLVDIQQLPDGVRLHFTDGTTAEHSAVIGCDGIKSCTRKMVLGDVPETNAVFSGKYVYRGLIPMDEAIEHIGEELATNSQMYCGVGGHVLTFPIEKGEIMNVVAFQTKDTWTDDQWVLPVDVTRMRKEFDGWGPEVKNVISLIKEPSIWALFNHLPAKTYCKGRICLLGDAAHASTPHQGSGAAMAIEDGYILSNLLGQINHSKDLEHVFAVYNASRRERSLKLVETSREAGMLYDLQDPVAGDDASKLAENLSRRYDWLWNVDLPGELASASELLRQYISS